MDISSKCMIAEDILSDHRVFLNGFNRENTCSFDSYMAILDYNALDKALTTMKSQFSKEDILEIIKFWKDTYGYLSPMFSMVYFEVERSIKKGG